MNLSPEQISATGEFVTGMALLASLMGVLSLYLLPKNENEETPKLEIGAMLIASGSLPSALIAEKVWDNVSLVNLVLVIGIVTGYFGVARFIGREIQ